MPVPEVVLLLKEQTPWQEPLLNLMTTTNP